MAKQKKIGFKYFLNKRADQEMRSEDAYPVYVRVTFNRKSTKMPPYAKFNLFWTQEMLDRFENNSGTPADEHNFELLHDCEELIEEVIRYEYDKDPEFTVVGSSQLIHTYQKSIEDILGIPLLIELKRVAQNSMIAKNYLDIFGENTPISQLNTKDVLAALLHYFGDWEQLQALLTEQTIFHIEAFCAYQEFVCHQSLNNFTGTIFNWIIKNDRKILAGFLSQMDEEDTCIQTLKEINFKQDLLDIYTEFIDNEAIKTLSLIEV
jgi:hypothetical protein